MRSSDFADLPVLVLVHGGTVSGVEIVFFFSSRRRHTRCLSDWSSDVCSSDLRIVRLLVIESLVVSALGAIGGLAGAWGAIRLIERLLPILGLDIVFDLAIDWRVAAFSAGIEIGRASCRERVKSAVDAIVME